MKNLSLTFGMILLPVLASQYTRAAENSYQIKLELSLSSAKLFETENLSGIVRFCIQGISAKESTTVTIWEPIFNIRIAPSKDVSKLVSAQFQNTPHRKVIVNKWYEIPFQVGLLPAFAKKIPARMRPAAVLPKGKYSVVAEVSFPKRSRWSNSHLNTINIDQSVRRSASTSLTVKTKASKPLDAPMIMEAMDKLKGRERNIVIAHYLKKGVLKKEHILKTMRNAAIEEVGAIAKEYLKAGLSAEGLYEFFHETMQLKIDDRESTPFLIRSPTGGILTIFPQLDGLKNFNGAGVNIVFLRSGKENSKKFNAPEKEGIYKIVSDIDNKTWGWILVIKKSNPERR